jgi:flagellar operon protein
MDILKNNFSSIEQVTGKYLNQNYTDSGKVSGGNAFEGILQQKFQSQETENEASALKFSKHASGRLEERNINLTQEQMDRLESGTRKAGEKGIQESLVLVDQLAFIVNIKNNTVVTAMEQGEQTETIYTNIDGAVII